MTPRFPPAGPGGHGSPPSAVLSGRYDFLPSHVLRLIVFASRFRGRLPGSCPPWGAPAAVQVRRRTGVWIVHAGRPLSSILAHGQEQDLPGSLATHPRNFAPVHDPGRPVAPRRWRRFRCCPHTLNSEGVVDSPISRLTPPLRHLLSTLHDGRCRTPCKTRFRLAGFAFAGRESNPLGRYERFQVMASSSPGLSLAQ